MKTVPSQHSTQGGDAQCQTTNEHTYGLNSLSFLKQMSTKSKNLNSLNIFDLRKNNFGTQEGSQLRGSGGATAYKYTKKIIFDFFCFIKKLPIHHTSMMVHKRKRNLPSAMCALSRYKSPLPPFPYLCKPLHQSSLHSNVIFPACMPMGHAVNNIFIMGNSSSSLNTL